MSSSRPMRFGVFELDPAARQLRKNGTRIKLQDQPFRVLQLLLERPGEVVTRDELKEKLWSDDTFVEFDHSLNTSVQKIRQALGDSATSPRFLETIPKVGYRFVAPVNPPPLSTAQTGDGVTPAPVEEGTEPHNGAPSGGRYLPVAIGVAGVAALLLVIAFIPFNGEQRGKPLPYLRFALEPAGSVQEAAISPDGKSVAYVAVSESKASLYVHDLDQDAPRRLDIHAPYALYNPVWSRDSERIFVRTGVGYIRRVLAAGGPPETIFHRPDGIGYIAYDPGSDGVIFSAGNPAVFYAVPSPGGEAQPLFEQQPDASTFHYHASFAAPYAPRTMMFDYGYFAVERSMAVRDFDRGRTTSLGPGAWPVYAPSGHVLYQAGQEGIWAAPFSLDRLETTGSPFRVEDRGMRPTVADNGVMAFVEPQDGGLQQLVWKDRAGRVIGRIGQPQRMIQVPVLSPDEKRVVVRAQDQADPLKPDIWVHETDSEVKTRVTFGPENEDRPTWLPDGTGISFSSQRGNAMDIFTVSAKSGSEPELLVGGEGSQFGFDWTPDGRYLVYDTPPQDIWLLEVVADGTSETKPVIEDSFDSYAPDLSANGDYLAYVSNESGRYEVFVRPFPQGFDRLQVSVNGGAQPRWRGDGKEIYYVEGGTLIAAAIELEPELRVADRVRLFTDAEAFEGRGQQYDVSSDGQRFVVVETVEEPPPPKIRIVQNWFARFEQQDVD